MPTGYTTRFAEVLLPLPVSGTFTYRIPQELNNLVSEGMRVVVQFGRRKFYTGLVRRIHEQPPAVLAVKYVLAVIDPVPVVNEKQFALWEWMASYYLCTPGEVMNAALPSAYKLASESRVVLDPEYVHDRETLNDREFQIVEALEIRKILTLTDISRIIGIARIIPIIKTMIEKGIVRLEEEITERYKPRSEVFVRLTEALHDETAMGAAMDKLNKKAFRQLQILMAYISLSHCFSGNVTEVSRTELLKTAKSTAVQLDGLVKKGILELYERNISRLTHSEALTAPGDIVLSGAQQAAYDAISQHLSAGTPCLLKGVTSSGKTEIYIRLMEEVIRSGRQVLFLLPEIALTTQIIQRLGKYFGAAVGVYHSRYNESERVEIWNKANRPLAGQADEQPYQIILGARSALFLPFTDLGLIIVDEEHDTSYKQNEPPPRYNARDAAVVLGNIHKAPVLLGSATPSIESYYNARQQKYALVELDERYGGIRMPEVRITDIREAEKLRQMKSHFSVPLLEAIGRSLDAGEQVILFQNRRGFSLRLECDTCHYTPQCINCDVTLIYHKQINLLKCHYCGYSAPVPPRCPECNSPAIKMKGFGTEKVEEELAVHFPHAVIGRMDLDTTRTKYAYQKIIGEFETGKIDILVGTQMVSKGLDFDKVSLVGVLYADGLLSYPDFRANERSFQMLAQVSGRAGRKNHRGLVIIQANNARHPLLKMVVENDYTGMFESQLSDRYSFRYPPYYRMIEISLQHKDYTLLNKAAEVLASSLRPVFGKMLLGPEYPMVARVRNQYIKNIMLKTGKGKEAAHLKFQTMKIIDKFRELPDYKGVKIQLNVDPV